jgi:hypothetical protein
MKTTNPQIKNRIPIAKNRSIFLVVTYIETWEAIIKRSKIKPKALAIG